MSAKSQVFSHKPHSKIVMEVMRMGMRIMSIKPGLESIAEVMRLNWRTINSLNCNLNGLIIQSRSLAAAISAQHFFSGAKHGRPPACLRPQWLRESHPL